MTKYKSIFSPSTPQQRQTNFEDYWVFSQNHSGVLDEAEKDLSNKREKLRYFQLHPVRSKKPLPHPETFYRNYVELKDDPKKIDKKTLTLMCIYKFARHEWVGISGAWDVVPTMENTHSLTDKISKYHLAEEFCHVRLFHEMFKVFHLDKVEWVRPGPFMEKMYRVFPKLPETWMSPPAFITELMGITFYTHLNRLFDEVFADEPEACKRLKELLGEIMVDELAHIGQRRNFIGAVGIKLSKKMIAPLYTMFFKDIPESKHLFDVKQMIQDGLSFDYNQVDPALLEKSWVPSYCHSNA